MKKVSPKRKVIRVECEETQDYVRESLDLRKMEEISFVPSAISILQRPTKPSVYGSLHRYWWESYTANSCQQKLVAKGGALFEVVEEAHRGRL